MKIWNRLRQWWQARSKARAERKSAKHHRDGFEFAHWLIDIGESPEEIRADATRRRNKDFAAGMREAVSKRVGFEGGVLP